MEQERCGPAAWNIFMRFDRQRCDNNNIRPIQSLWCVLANFHRYFYYYECNKSYLKRQPGSMSTPHPSPSVLCSSGRMSDSTVRLFLRLETKAMLLFAMVVAIASIGRIDQALTLYAHSIQGYQQDSIPGYRALRSLVITGTHFYAGDQITKHHHPRVVFVENSFSTKAEVDYTSAKRKDQNVSTQLRRHASRNDKEEIDATRFYDQGDSVDFPQMELRKWPQHEFDSDCEPMAKWQSDFHPVCNEIHSVADIRQSLIDEELSLLSNQGFWRHAWRHDERRGDSASTVWKTFKFDHNFEEKYYEDNRVDIVAMERLSSSPYIVNAYAFCGLTVVQEFAGKELGDVVDGRRVKSLDKLKLAKQIAQGVAHIHSIKNDDGKLPEFPTLVNNDINPSNLLFAADGRPVFNDFNIAVLVMKQKKTGTTCPFYSHFPNPQWKAPEEQVVRNEHSEIGPRIVDSKVDIYALGNILFRIAVGSGPWKHPEVDKLSQAEKDRIAHLKRYNGTIPTIPVDILNSNDPSLAAILEAMRLCYSFDPANRPTAAEIVNFLDYSIAMVQENERAARLTRSAGRRSLRK